MTAKTPKSMAQAFAQAGKNLERNVATALKMAGSMATAHAKATDLFKDRSGTLRNSIAFEGPTGTFAGGDMVVTVSAGAPHGLWVEKGTRAHDIKPKYRQALRWPVQGGFGFAKIVRHPGTTPRPFLDEALKATEPKLREDLIPKAVELSFVQAGLR